MGSAAAIEWKLAAFDDLSVRELHDLLLLRSQVFMLEQNCLFLDIDGFDPQAVHLLGQSDGQLLAYARCFAAGIKFPEASVGRVVTCMDVRGSGLGHVLMAQVLASVRALWGEQAIRIGAQARLEKFYQQHGFVSVGKPYIEDGIDHLEMLWRPPTLEFSNDH